MKNIKEYLFKKYQFTAEWFFEVILWLILITIFLGISFFAGWLVSFSFKALCVVDILFVLTWYKLFSLTILRSLPPKKVIILTILITLISILVTIGVSFNNQTALLNLIILLFLWFAVIVNNLVQMNKVNLKK
jgi:hypothetical protein